MSEGNDQEAGKGRLSLRPAARLELGRTVDAGSVRQTFSHGRSKVVQVEVRKKRTGAPPATGPGGASAPSATPGDHRARRQRNGADFPSRDPGARGRPIAYRR
jgi:translation initiation factor IF-2